MREKKDFLSKVKARAVFFLDFIQHASGDEEKKDTRALHRESGFHSQPGTKEKTPVSPLNRCGNRPERREGGKKRGHFHASDLL